MPLRPSAMAGPMGLDIDISAPETEGPGVLETLAENPSLPLSMFGTQFFGPLPDMAMAQLGVEGAEERMEQWKRAFRMDNLIGGMLNMPRLSGVDDPEFNVLRRAEEEGVLEHFDFFMTMRNEDDFQLKLQQFRREQDDRRALAEAGLPGMQMGMAAGILDAPSLVPGGAVVRGASRARNVATVGSAAGFTAAATEVGLHGVQATRTAEESALAIGGSVVLGGIFGAALGKAMPKDEFQRLADDIEKLPSEIDRVRQSLSAAATDINPQVFTDDRFALRNEGRFHFMRKFPGGYLADVAERFGAPGLGMVLDKFAPLAPFTRLTPTMRTQMRGSQEARRVGADLFETPLQYSRNDQGIVVSDGGSVETRSKYRTNAMLNENLWAIQKGYSGYVKDGPTGTIGTLLAPLTGRYAHLAGKGKLKPKQFAEEVGRAMFSSDTHPVKAVADTAAGLRQRVFEPLRRDLVDVGFFDELPFKPKYGESYMTRMYRADKIRANERAVERRFFQEFRRSRDEAAMRTAGRSVEAEGKIGSDERLAAMTDDELEEAVKDTITAIKGLRVGDTIMDAVRSRPLRARVLDIPDQVLLDLDILETDVGILTEHYVRGVIPRVELMRKFGTLDHKVPLREVEKDYQRLREDASGRPREVQRLETEEKAFREDFAGMWERILGIYDMPRNPDDIWTRAARTAKSLTYMQLLGSMVMAAIPDVSGLISRAGLGEFSKGIVELGTNMPKFARASKEAAELLNAIEWVGNTRARALAELDGRYMQTTLAERAIEGATGVFSHATGITAWNTVWKSVSNVMVMSRILKAADASVRGKATTAQKRALSENFIDEKLAARIAKQFEKHGDRGTALWFANARNWSDDGAFTAGQQAMSRETDIAVITPGQDKPLWFSTRVGSVIFQLKTFGAAANERILLSGVQRFNADVIAQFAVLFALGAVVSNLRADIAGRPRKEGRNFVIDAIDRAGPFQIAFEANSLFDAGGFGMSSMFGTQVPSRFQSRSKLLGAAGPTADMVKTIMEIGQGVRSEKGLSSRDIDKITRLIPGQNTPYGLLFRNDIREGIGSVLGVDYESK